APGNLAAKTAKKKGVTLSWSAPVTGGSATGYRIYRGTSSGGETLLTSVGLVTTFKDTKTVSGTRYYYTVAATGPGGEGPASSEASAIAK
ncbi:MAG TPA: fibronectin type III domain-containing protein, partial [Actinomycetota bacterium]|nr:fibronectin type III domain-containing protein [Actinomycetota bacterium]